MATKAVRLNTTSGKLERTPDLVETSEVASTPSADKIPRASVDGTLAPGWISGPLPISVLPVAVDGEMSSTKLVRANDSRLGNPAVGGDLGGSALAATVIRLQGRAVANTPPLNGDGLVWNSVGNRWEPATVGGGAGNATQLQGRNIASGVPALNDTLVWNGTAWAPAAVSGGGASPAASLFLFERYT